jgi:hypothetical protein
MVVNHTRQTKNLGIYDLLVRYFVQDKCSCPIGIANKRRIKEMFEPVGPILFTTTKENI